MNISYRYLHNEKIKTNLNCIYKLSRASPAHTSMVPAPWSVILQPMTVAVSVFFAAPVTGQMHINLSFAIWPMPERQQKKSHDRRLVALATHNVFQLFYYELFNFHYGYQLFADVYVISETKCGVNIFIKISIKHKRARFLRCLFIEVSLIYR